MNDAPDSRTIEELRRSEHDLRVRLEECRDLINRNPTTGLRIRRVFDIEFRRALAAAVHGTPDDQLLGNADIALGERERIGGVLESTRTPGESLTLELTETTVMDDPVEAIATIARAFDMKTLAEGVERTGELAFLHEAGCDLIQGYTYSPAVPPEQFEAMLGTACVPRPAGAA